MTSLHKIIFSLVFGMIPGMVFSFVYQKDTIKLEPIDTLLGEYVYFDADPYGGNVYGVRKNETTLVKMPSSYQYSNKNFGDLHAVDATNPFELLLFYKDYQRLVFLDRTLAEVGDLDLGAQGVWDVKAVCLSKSNDLWLWEEVGFTLQKIDKQGALLTQSRDLRLLLDTIPHFVRLQAYSDRVYALDENSGIYSFDINGQLDAFIPLTDIRDFFIFQNKIFMVGNGHLLVYNLASHNFDSLLIEYGTNIREARPTSKGVLLLVKDKIILYKEKTNG